MSLLDDVSIVVTPNGYKAGELYAVVPVPVEGAELVTDSDFLLTGTQAENTTGTYWTTGDSWSISGGNATLDGTQAGGSSLISNLFTVEAGRMYKVTVNVSSTSSGFRLYDTIGVVDYGLDVGENTFYRIPSSSTSSFNVTVLGLAGTTGEVSSVSVKEYTSADMDVTRATAATRVDENGLVNYAEVLGDEELTDGGFPTGTSAWYEGTGWSLGNGYAESDGTNAPLDQYNALEIGKQYIVVITVTGMTASPLSVRLGTSSSDQVLQITSDGTYTAYGTAGSTTFRLRSQGFNGKVTNVSVKEVTRDNVPRIDYTGGGCPHILAEPQRTNLVTYSEDFTQWGSDISGTGTTPVVTLNYATSPSGEQNASRLQLDIGSGTSSNDFSQLSEAITISNSTVYSRSIYFKSNTGSNQDIVIQTNGEGITTSTITTEWQRFEASPTSENTSGFIRIRIRGNEGTVSQADILVWGAQLEEGSYPTSYIPNFGTLLGVTRNQDIFTRDGIGSLINSTEGVLFVEMAALSDDNTDRRLSLNDGSNANEIRIGYSRFTGNIISEIVSGGSVQNVNWGATGVTQTNNNKFALSWGSGTMKFYVNGLQTNIETGITSPIGLNTLKFSLGNDTLNMFAEVKQLQVYNTALTNAQLTSLTS